MCRSFELGEPHNTLTVYRDEGDSEVIEVDQYDAYTAELEYFVSCVRDGVPAVRATPRDAIVALRVGLAAGEAARSAAAVTIPRRG